ncbi:MAG: hypothetical protein JNL79_16205 [Myxococcales bacterium]|nr:hypothetical protein [Myxococcales bacterium]
MRPRSPLALCVLAACSAGTNNDQQTQAGALQRSPLSAVRSAAGALAPLLAPRVTKLHRSDNAFVATSTAVDELDVRVGARSITVAVGPSRRAPIELTLLGARPAELAIEEGHVVSAGVLHATDRVVSFYGAQVEEWLLLRDASAPRELRWSLRADHVVRGTEGELLALDDRGNVQLRVAKPFAIDGLGARHELDLGWDGRSVSIVLDASIDRYPVLVDPVVEIPVWTVAATGYGAYGTTMSGGSMTYDRASAKTYLYVGRGLGGTADRGMAEWTGTAWTARAFGGGVPNYIHDFPTVTAAQGKVFSFGGCESPSTCSGKDFTWDPGGGFWSDGYSSNVWRGAATTVLGTSYASDRVMIVGGEDPLVLGDLPRGVFTGNPTGVITPRYLYPTNPPERYGAALAYDKARNRVVLVGGADQSGVPYQDTWEYDATFIDSDSGNPWTKVCPKTVGAVTTNCPFSARYGLALTYDSARGKILMYGGFGASGARLDDTWQYDGAGWKAWCGVSAGLPTCAPGALADAAMAYDVPSGRALLAGGSKTSTTYADKTWAFHRRGGSCTSGAQCDTGFCVDGTCCETASCGTCEQCDAAGSPGVCAKVAAGAKDPDSCTATTGSCDGAGACKLDNGQSCATGGASSCLSGFCADGFCCNEACVGSCDTCAKVKGGTIDGTCSVLAKSAKAAGEPSCAPFLCGGGVGCPTTCAADGDCATGNYCAKDATCKPKKALGAACALGTDCPSGGCSPCETGFCVDGVCCDSACTSLCNACAASLKATGLDGGKCGPTAAGADPHADCTDARTVTPVSCKTDGACNGSGACRLYAKGTKCGATAITCVDGKASGEQCNGLGDCEKDAAPADCFPGLCSTIAGCTKKCTSDGDCATAGAFCDTAVGECVKARLPGEGCTVGPQCASKLCVDGVCCNRPCGGQCEACDVEGSRGTCVSVVGEPHGVRSKCATGDAANPCAAARCDGIEPSKCLGFATSAVSCRSKGCVDGVATLSAVCDGRGACPAAETKTCKPYACAADTCKTSCAADLDCAAGSTCSKKGECINAGVCDGDHTVTSADGKDKTDCTPYRCTASGTCRDACTTSDDCTPGTLCDLSAGVGRCIPPTTTAEDSGGCALAPKVGPLAGTPSGALALFLVAIGRMRRRRTRARER